MATPSAEATLYDEGTALLCHSGVPQGYHDQHTQQMPPASPRVRRHRHPLWVMTRFLGSTPRVWIICWIYISLAVVLDALVEQPRAPGGYEEVCQWEQFSTQCLDKRVVLMKTAKYGRMRFGGCLKEDHGHLGCFANVLGHLDKKCSGTLGCTMDIPDADLHKTNDCPKELMPYLEVSYDCVEVANLGEERCEHPHALQLYTPSGFISSAVSDQFGMGSVDCPWVIRLEPGRKVNFTLMNFSAKSDDPRSTSGSTSSLSRTDQSIQQCQTYARIHEKNKVFNVTGCIADGRERQVYVSDTNIVRVEIVANTAQRVIRKFLLKHEAIGCPDIVPKQEASVKRVGNKAVVKCNHTDITYYLSCEGTQWIGDIGNCTKGHWHTKRVSKGFTRFPYGILVVIGIGVALGVAVGIVMLMSILICVRRRRERKMRCVTSDPLLDELPHESEENHANCNCEAAKIYLAAGMETRRLGNGKHRGDGLPQHTPGNAQHPLPMPDMCMIERTSDKRADSDGTAGHGNEHQDDNARPEMQQTSFITFKPASIYGTARRPGGSIPTTGDSPPVGPGHAGGLRADTLPIYGRLGGRELYGTLPQNNAGDSNCRTPLAHISIYEKRPAPGPPGTITSGPGCVECEREMRVVPTYGPLPGALDKPVAAPVGVVAVVNDQVA